MPNWKKVIVSGSNAELNTIQASEVSGSFSGSFQGDGSQLTEVLHGSGTPTFYPKFDINGDLESGTIYESTLTSRTYFQNPVQISQTLYVNAISAGGTLGTSGQVLSSTGTDTQWITNSGGGGVSNELAIAYAIALG
tara:strand:- start:337 stop:747 length:411 start_codon:yes stop_codon:yes gene_type:complete